MGFAARIDCMGVPLAQGTFDDVRGWFFASARSRGRTPKVLAFADAATCNHAWADPDHRERLTRTDLLLNDGAGIALYGRLAGLRFAQSFAPADVFHRLFASAQAERPLRVFLYGGPRGRAAVAAARIEASFPHVRIVGTLEGSARGDDVLETINEACADVLVVDMPAPLLHEWIDENADLLDVGVVAGAGAVVDAFAGRLPSDTWRGRARRLVAVAVFVARAIAYLGVGIAPRALPF